MDTMQLDLSSLLYEGCGNTFIIVPVYRTQFSEEKSLKTNTAFLEYLMGLFHQHEVDSMMILLGDLDKKVIPEMLVFEPRGKQEGCSLGSWSTMCGNGVRAVAQYLINQHGYSGNSGIEIKTESGILTVNFLEKGIDVVMGYGSFSVDSVRDFIHVESFHIEHDLMNVRISQYSLDASIGCVGLPDTSGIIRGEPHCIIRSKDHLSLQDLQQQCIAIGTKLSVDNDLFPHEMNTNCFSVQNINHRDGIVIVYLCTYERGVYKVTQACGTGATTLASYLYKELDISDEYTIDIQNLGGILHIYQENGMLHLCGPASRMEK